MNWIARIFNYPMLAAQLRRERELHAAELEALRADAASAAYHLEEKHEAEIERWREDYGRLFNAYNRVVDRIGQKSGMLPIFEERPAAKAAAPEVKELMGKGPMARAAARGAQRGDELLQQIKGEVKEFVEGYI